MNAPRTTRSLARSTPGLLLATLMIGLSAQGLAFTAFVAALPQMALDFGEGGELTAQMTMALLALGLMIGSLVSGWILERLGTRATLLIALAIYTLCGLVGALVGEPVVLLGSRFVAGLAVACLVTTCIWAIAAEYDGDRRAKVLGLNSSLSNISALAGTVLGGYLAHTVGWHFAFVQYVVFGLCALALAFAGIRQVKPQPAVSDRPRESQFTRLLPLYLLAALLFCVLFMASTQFAFVLRDNGVANSVIRSLILGTVTVVGALIAFVYGPLQQRLGVLGTFLFGILCMAVALAINGLGLSVHTAFAVIAAALMGVYAGLVIPYLYHTVTELTDEQSRSRAIGAVTAFGFFGGFLNPPVFVAMSKEFGMRSTFLIVACVMAAVAAGTAIKMMRGGNAVPERPLSH